MSDFAPGSADTARAFRDALGRFATGVTIVTCESDNGPLGITANSFASVSLDPPLVLWSPAKASRRFPPFRDAPRFAIHILGSEQRGVCGHFAQQGHDFDGLDWSQSAEGVPLLDGCLARFECKTHAQHDGGDHLIIVGEVERARFRDGEPLLFAHGGYGRFTNAE
ncbi:MAG: flavin reductase family protein [Pseudomonadota bacterium]